MDILLQVKIYFNIKKVPKVHKAFVFASFLCSLCFLN